jgi:hypothetical protein
MTTLQEHAMGGTIHRAIDYVVCNETLATLRAIRIRSPGFLRRGWRLTFTKPTKHDASPISCKHFDVFRETSKTDHTCEEKGHHHPDR